MNQYTRSGPTPRQLEVLRLIRDNPDATYDELCEILAVASTNAVYKHVEALKRRGLLEHRFKERVRTLTVRGVQALEIAK